MDESTQDISYLSRTLTKVTSSYLSGLHGAVSDSDEVSGDAMAPPQLARDAPVPARKETKQVWEEVLTHLFGISGV